MKLRAGTQAAGVMAAYLAITAAYSHPLLTRAHDAIAHDRYDPVLSASILWWNATTLPFSAAWWNPPHYFPATQVAAFTENMVGLGAVATPIFWATRDPILTYNYTVFSTWVLSAFAAFLLARSIGATPGAAFVGGLAFGFAPYRIGQLAHVHVLGIFWLPVALLALHRYMEQRRLRWLVLFGCAWMLQALTNGYFMLFGGVLIAMWLAYFGSTRITSRLIKPILSAWVAASLPLVPIFLKYRNIHATYGLERELGTIAAFGADPWSWVSVSPLSLLWGGLLRDSPREANLFPGATVFLVVTIALLWRLLADRSRIVPASRATSQRKLRAASGILAVLSCATILATLAIGPWRAAAFGMSISVSSIDRALIVAIVSLAAYLRLRGMRFTLPQRRSVFVFYVLGTAACAVLCLGPYIHAGNRAIVLDYSPYRWLLLLPGFDGLRVPTRFWMVGTLCLAMAAALGLDRLAPRRTSWRLALFALVSSGVLADAWLQEMPMAPAPVQWADVESADESHALLELPLGPGWDAAAAFRAVAHRRRVVNGVSGHEPPHYALLQRGLEERDESVLVALTTLGPLDVVVDGSEDPDGGLARYVSSISGATRVASDGIRTAYRMPHSPLPSALARDRVSIVAARGSDGADARLALDGDPATAWAIEQNDGAYIELDLGTSRPISGVTQTVGQFVESYPRRLAVDVSPDGTTWQTVWEGSGLGPTVLGLINRPREPHIEIQFASTQAKVIRLRLRSACESSWRIAEVWIHAP